MNPRAAALLLTATFSLATAAGAAPSVVVACAPGYPGTTAEAQPAMDAFAAALGPAAGFGKDGLAALYYPQEDTGLARLQKPDVALALVPLPFYLAHRKELGLVPQAEVVPVDGTASETWTLVAAKGRIRGAADLDNWQILGLAGYAPRFVRGVALAAWGAVPASTKILPSGAVLSGLRRAASGDSVAMLLDSAQAAALDDVPFVKELVTVTSSRAMPGSLLCAVGGHLPKNRQQAVAQAVLKLDAKPAGAAALAGLRLTRFVALDAAALARAEKEYDAARP